MGNKTSKGIKARSFDSVAHNKPGWVDSALTSSTTHSLSSPLSCDAAPAGEGRRRAKHSTPTPTTTAPTRPLPYPQDQKFLSTQPPNSTMHMNSQNAPQNSATQQLVQPMGKDKHNVGNDDNRHDGGKDLDHNNSRTNTNKVDWCQGELIGRGAMGSVYRAFDRTSGKFIAVKEVRIARQSHAKSLEKEIDILRAFNHPNIVSYLGCEWKGQVVNIFLEYLPGGSVADLLAKYGNFSEDLAKKYTTQIIFGLRYLHGHNCIHRDIKGANVLVTHQGRAKLSDFGCAKVQAQTHNQSAATMAGTPYWMAPEAIQQKKITTASDIWSLGATVVEMVTGKPPFSKEGQINAMHAICRGQSPIPPGLSEELTDFLKTCFTLDYENRPTCSELLKHRWLYGTFSSHRSFDCEREQNQIVGQAGQSLNSILGSKASSGKLLFHYRKKRAGSQKGEVAPFPATVSAENDHKSPVGAPNSGSAYRSQHHLDHHLDSPLPRASLPSSSDSTFGPHSDMNGAPPGGPAAADLRIDLLNIADFMDIGLSDPGKSPGSFLSSPIGCEEEDGPTGVGIPCCSHSLAGQSQSSRCSTPTQYHAPRLLLSSRTTSSHHNVAHRSNASPSPPPTNPLANL